ncbi:glutamyl-tRNA(Gln) and/or aspartyl-tRNA(Asn) amidotransferase, C subunit [Desulfocapsa sulfexigens DSM 10523]|uniref:Aspartyl/glutamyl-tRNA(Asn/Gln) amidotransferase subunit C n=1 Tax=Desulfocapsa sulfexigens (strain DSM 10523 / SB164P1) TaxID=1167006 RepID=M1PD14_DESSD|nr:Asp-tRNA(Asn)/Glu-tRNA(Gln) amidotransferase subunit GatC [Desulfocapsa sulfexigens]AGF77650.1 glutamyl-tRNA(Gln) and/or aspartyl-tRNA(Asn) amidotransferase, C subunit [Desulfocapsa sulfexigens DSM 10523]
MKITREEVEHVAKLAKLNMSEEELARMTGQLDTILLYVAKLDELDTAGVPPTTHAFSISNAFREDEVQKSLSVDEALSNGPHVNEDAFIVPKII